MMLPQYLGGTISCPGCDQEMRFVARSMISEGGRTGGGAAIRANVSLSDLKILVDTHPTPACNFVRRYAGSR